ncbi:MAG: MBL fold metallo-hydrolase [Desulfobacterales bacterium]|nr:MBL fold metallo-hydrolase [Desulfobacterales bacterium]
MEASQLRICMLASGSKGNAIFISNGSTSILFDAGLSGIEIERRLKSRNLDAKNIDAIIVSHEHSDHIKGVGVLSRRFDLPVYISKKTMKKTADVMGKVHSSVNFECGREFHMDALSIHPFSLSHDAIDPAGFIVKGNGTKIGIVTDLGIATSMVKEHLKKCSFLVLEANHDPHMLVEGPYPWPLKQRVKGRTGHLSNNEAKELLMEISHDSLDHVILAHLSETNNTPEKALKKVGEAINLRHIKLSVATQDCAGELISVR